MRILLATLVFTTSVLRDLEQQAPLPDVALTDIAVKALSPAVNDSVTAAHAVGHVADLLVRLLGRRLGPTLHEDGHGVGRVVVPDRDVRYYLDTVCGPIRRYGRSAPSVLVALLRMLRDAAGAARDDDQRAELGAQVDNVVADTAEQPDGFDADQVHDMAGRVRQALAGDIRRAYRTATVRRGRAEAGPLGAGVRPTLERRGVGSERGEAFAGSARDDGEVSAGADLP